MMSVLFRLKSKQRVEVGTGCHPVTDEPFAAEPKREIKGACVVLSSLPAVGLVDTGVGIRHANCGREWCPWA